VEETGMRCLLARLRNDESGATAIEYGLMAALMVVVVLAGMGATGTSIGDIYRATINIAVVALAG
jgi:pilus assembly protein Flp/PilA